MNRQHAGATYWTTYFDDNEGGCAGIRLHRKRGAKVVVAAEVVYWDAVGQFFVQTLNGEVPLEILEAAIAAARSAVRVS